MQRAYYSDSIDAFLKATPTEILGALSDNTDFAVGVEQRDSWRAEIEILKRALAGLGGALYFEYSIPRMGRRIDVVALIGPAIFVLEFKTKDEFTAAAVDQVWDYALDLKNFHETSHDQFIAPVLIVPNTEAPDIVVRTTPHNDKLLCVTKTNAELLSAVLTSVLQFADGCAIDRTRWESGHYHPTPTIIEAAIALYNGHSVKDISRSDAAAQNLTVTTDAISTIIRESQARQRKSICFVTGVPGAGKTLVGLNIATTHIDKRSELYSVFLSGNGPLVAILREALSRDKIRRTKESGGKIRKYEAMAEVKAFIQNVHHFRDDCLLDSDSPTVEHVALFDEAQRAWDLEQTARFMLQKRKRPNFNKSEPEFLISCLDRHTDWAVIVCLVGGGQEINTGEAGITEWAESLARSFGHWDIYVSSRLTDSEHGAGQMLQNISMNANVFHKDELHLGVSMRSFRAENVSLLVKQLLDCDEDRARLTLEKVRDKYPIVITRELSAAKKWLKQQARGSERYGIVVSSQAERLRPHAINVKSPMNPIHWFLHGKEDVRSSYYLEDVATEFHVQGLELDWACVTWDADFRYTPKGWQHWSFCGERWNRIKKSERQRYLKNAYRVLLTRARQGMVIVVPAGEPEDRTRMPDFYDGTFEYLRGIGLAEI